MANPCNQFILDIAALVRSESGDEPMNSDMSTSVSA